MTSPWPDFSRVDDDADLAARWHAGGLPVLDVEWIPSVDTAIPDVPNYGTTEICTVRLDSDFATVVSIDYTDHRWSRRWPTLDEAEQGHADVVAAMGGA